MSENQWGMSHGEYTTINRYTQQDYDQLQRDLDAARQTNETLRQTLAAVVFAVSPMIDAEKSTNYVNVSQYIFKQVRSEAEKALGWQTDHEAKE